MPTTGSSVCVGELCRLAAMSPLSPPMEQIVFVSPEIVDLSLETFVNETRNWIVSFWLDTSANTQIYNGKIEEDGCLELFQP